MRIASYQEAVALGMGDVWLREMGERHAGLEGSSLKYRKEAKSSSSVVVPPAKTQAVDDGFNKLERAFWERLQGAMPRYFAYAWPHSMKFVVIGGCRWYTPDFVARTQDGGMTIFETKGFMREDASLKLIAAASQYPCFSWILVGREKRIWNCCRVTAKGFSRDYFTPDWLA
jgi:hypothetical protein